MKASSRREFLRRASAFSLLGGAAPLGLNLAAMGQAAAATAGGYKALVCLFMCGGNDAYNTVLATDAASWANYQAARPADNLGLRAVGVAPVPSSSNFHEQLGGVLAINPRNTQGRSFALHPSMAGVRDLFASGKLAVVSNLGPLATPTTKAAYDAKQVALPAKLFSHNDQQSAWQAFAADGAQNGWGGRMADLFMANNTRANFSSITLQSGSVWVNGLQVRGYQMAPTGLVRIGSDTGMIFGSSVAQQKLVSIMRNTRWQNLAAKDHAAVAARANDAETLLAPVLPAADLAPWGTPGLTQGQIDPLLAYTNPDNKTVALNPLAQQLQAVARMIAARAALGIQRQVFFVQLNGFDSHENQARSQATQLTMVNQALNYFNTTLERMGLSNDVTTFTASDFGRTFSSNGDGTDHGWGGHHFVMGGAVKGGDIYGRFPDYGVADGSGAFNSNDQVRNGALLPAISVDQYGATLARWFGVSDTEARDIFPNLARFSTSNLGFMV